MALNFTPPTLGIFYPPVKVMLKHVLVMMLLAPRALVWGASDEATWGKGLEVDSTTSLPVLIEELSEEAKKIGPQPRTIRGSCQSIAPKGRDNSGEQLTGGEHEGYLLVRINVVRDLYFLPALGLLSRRR